MLVITGATGKTGSVVAETLIAKGQKIRVLGRDEGKLKGFTNKGTGPEAISASAGGWSRSAYGSRRGQNSLFGMRTGHG